MAAVPSKVPTLLSKFQGCLIGAVLGDCLGSYYEGDKPQKIAHVLKNIELIEKTDRKRTFTYFTDDTAMARSVAASLISNKGFDSSDMAHRFSSEYFKEPGRGYGGSVIVVFQRLKDSDYQDVYRPASEQFDGNGSYGNGGAMRIAPASLFAYKHGSFETLKVLVENITRLTHTHMHAIHGSILQSLAVDLALRETDTSVLDTTKFIDTLIKNIQPLEEAQLQKAKPISPDDKKKSESPERGVADEPSLPYTHKLRKIKDFLREGCIDPDIIEEVLGTGVAALESVPTAIYSFLRSLREIEGLEDRNGFERSIIFAISLGGDTDTIATMAAAISGAFYGLEALPESWKARCEGVKDALSYAEDLYKLSQT